MNSALYKCTVMHHRMEPKPHRLHYRIFMFWLDLDEIDSIAKKFPLISRNRFNIFSFCDSDHLQLPAEKPDTTKNVKQQILDYLKSQNSELSNPRIYLLTNLRTMGYQFNPVSFYFVYDESAVCCVAEVSNTFGEMKLFYIGQDALKDNVFAHRTKKYFYVSPFMNHNLDFEFRLAPPTDKLNFRIDDYAGDKRIFISTLTGEKKPLTGARLAWYSLRFPLITLQIIGLIHWNALLLWLKKLPYLKKKENPEQQLEVLRKYHD